MLIIINMVFVAIIVIAIVAIVIASVAIAIAAVIICGHKRNLAQLSVAGLLFGPLLRSHNIHEI